ncbi:MAG: hypothetical protein AB7I59_04220 [Geminicoccaceae bacterium]
MIEYDPRATDFLRESVPVEWNRAATTAAWLASRARYLPWTDRAKAFDELYWSEARRRLATDAITAIVNRQATELADPGVIATYGRFCGAVTTAVLLQLDEPLAIEEEAAALIHFFSLADRHREAAIDWIGGRHQLELAASLPCWPGCAFLLLILSPSDSAESFMARDAFWTAMLGRG